MLLSAAASGDAFSLNFPNFIMVSKTFVNLEQHSTTGLRFRAKTWGREKLFLARKAVNDYRLD